jgi:hypothetical protein
MKKPIKFKIKAATPRLSDEDTDPLEQEDSDKISLLTPEEWLPWDTDDILDVKMLISTKMSAKQRFILEAFLDGKTYSQVGVTEKYWRYHFAKGVEFIKKELKL